MSLEQGFARRWLGPRLLRLREETGEHDLDLRLENRLAGFVGEGIDAAIRYGDGAWPGFETVQLFSVRFFQSAVRLSLRHIRWRSRPTFIACRCCATRTRSGPGRTGFTRWAWRRPPTAG